MRGRALPCPCLGPRLAVALLVTVALALGTGCHGGGSTRTNPEQAVYRFPHAAPPHARLACVECHPGAQVLEGVLARPGVDDHAPCDRSGCHATDFLAANARLCTLCHTRVAPRVAGGSTPAPYPPIAGPRALASEFSHATHLDAGRMERGAGFHVACGDCHARAATETELAPPGHAACVRCHAPQEGAAPLASPPIDQCEACHTRRPADPARARRFITGDLRFAHGAHEQDRAGRAIPCVTCHPQVARLGHSGDTSLPTTATCVACHDDEQRVPRAAAMASCTVCHDRALGRVQTFAVPRSHLAPRERPEDHTLAFRKDHGAEARHAPERCATCHTRMSGTSRDNCDECHQVTRPADHDPSWREYEHGPEAAASAERCTVCHDGDYCVSCHQRRPRSHFFAGFEQGAANHADLARRDPRACLTCHDERASCERAGCHLPAGGRP